MTPQEHLAERAGHILLDALVAADVALDAYIARQATPEQVGDGVLLALELLRGLAIATVPADTALPAGLRVDVTPLTVGVLDVTGWLLRELAARTGVDREDVIIELREHLSDG